MHQSDAEQADHLSSVAVTIQVGQALGTTPSLLTGNHN
jgi:hypothetical protein